MSCGSRVVTLLIWIIGQCTLCSGSVLADAAIHSLSTKELVEIRDISGISVSPDGAYVAFRMDSPDITTNEVVMKWYIARIDTLTEPRPVADAGDSMWDASGLLTTQTPIWSRDSEWLYYRALHGQQVQIWRARRDGFTTEQVTTDSANVQDFVLDESNNRLLYFVGPTRDETVAQERDRYDKGVVLDATIIPGFPIAQPYPHDGRLGAVRRCAGTESCRLLPGVTGDSEKRMLAVSLRSHAAGVALRVEDTAKAADQAIGVRTGEPKSPDESLSPSRGRMALLVRRSSVAGKSGTARRKISAQTILVWRDLSGNDVVSCVADVCTGEDIRILGWWGERSVVFRTSNLFGQRLYRWRVDENRVYLIRDLAGVIGSDGKGSGVCSLAGDEAICVTAGSDQPPRLDAISLETGAVRPLFEPNKNISRASLGETERLVITDEYGDRASAYLVVPRNSGGVMPLVITSYQCDGFLRGGSGMDVPEHVLAGVGIISVCINDNHTVVRVDRLGDRTEVSQSASLALRRAVIRLLRDRGLIDTKRVAATGLSYGASSTLYAISHSRLFAVAEITSQGYDDPMEAYFYGATNLFRHPTHGEISSPYLNPAHFRKISPALNAAHITTPLLMQLSDTEYLQMMQLYANLRDLGRPVEMIVYPDEYHIKSQPRHRLAVYDTSVAWLRFWLQDDKKIDVPVTSLVARWRVLRGTAEATR